MIYYDNDKCFLVLLIYISLLCFISFFFFFQKAENNRFVKKTSWPKLCNIIFLFLLKIGLVRHVEQQINFITTVLQLIIC